MHKEKKFSCPRCNNGFTTKYALRVHTNSERACRKTDTSISYDLNKSRQIIHDKLKTYMAIKDIPEVPTGQLERMKKNIQTLSSTYRNKLIEHADENDPTVSPQLAALESIIDGSEFS